LRVPPQDAVGATAVDVLGQVIGIDEQSGIAFLALR
jgi:hypothetical protein